MEANDDRKKGRAEELLLGQCTMRGGDLARREEFKGLKRGRGKGKARRKMKGNGHVFSRVSGDSNSIQKGRENSFRGITA